MAERMGNMFHVLDEVKKNRIIAALRGVSPEYIGDTAKALYEGGIRMLEITFSQSSPTKIEDTCRSIKAARDAVGGRMLIGAGTVMSCEEVDAAYHAGAAYMLSPNLDLAVLRRAKELGMGAIPGAMSPTEVAEAYREGADMVKLFPCDVLGLAYIKALKAPLSHIPLLAMGGVNAGNLKSYLGLVEGVGVGSAICDKNKIVSGDFRGLSDLARTYTGQLEGESIT